MTEQEIVNLIPLDGKTNQLAQQIIETNDNNEMKDLIALFNQAQAKKNVVRIMKLNSLLDKVSDQMLARMEKHPGEFSNTDLINYFNVTQSAIDRANKSLQLLDETPMIQINEVNIGKSEEMSRESKEKVMNAINALLEKSRELNVVDSECEIVDIVEENQNKLNEEEENV